MANTIVIKLREHYAIIHLDRTLDIVVMATGERTENTAKVRKTLSWGQSVATPAMVIAHHYSLIKHLGI